MIKMYKNLNSTKTFNEFFEDFFKDVSFETKGYKDFDIIEKTDSNVIEMLVPGYKKENIKINIEDSILKISYETTEEEKYSKYVKSFNKSFKINSNVNIDDITASLEDGILRISIPKEKEELKKSKHIEIK